MCVTMGCAVGQNIAQSRRTLPDGQQQYTDECYGSYMSDTLNGRSKVAKAAGAVFASGADGGGQGC